MILHNLHVSTWIFKIDNEFNGWGHASLNVDGIKIVVDLWKKPIEITEKLTERVIEILDKALPNKAKICMPHLYKSWDEYLKNFLQHGGVIEATPVCLPNQISSPSISFMIEPNGDIDLIGSFDWFTGKDYVNMGAFFP